MCVTPQYTDRRVRADRLKPGDEVQLDRGRISTVRKVFLLDDQKCAVEDECGWHVSIPRTEGIRVTGLAPR